MGCEHGDRSVAPRFAPGGNPLAHGLWVFGKTLKCAEHSHAAHPPVLLRCWWWGLLQRALLNQLLCLNQNTTVISAIKSIAKLWFSPAWSHDMRALLLRAVAGIAAPLPRPAEDEQEASTQIGARCFFNNSCIFALFYS